MEVGLNSKIPTYTGGLGVLAGDTLKAAADMQFPMIGVTLLAKYGYFFQRIEDGAQKEMAVSWKVNDFLEPLDTTVTVKVAGEDVKVGCWIYHIKGIDGYQIPLLFLHTDFPENSESARSISDVLYGDGPGYRLQQEIVLGIGGVRMLNALGLTDIKHYHMNEGHAAFLTLELHKELNDFEQVKQKCIFTTHTPIPAGHDIFDMKLVQGILDPELFGILMQRYSSNPTLNLTELALDYSDYINGVAKKHTEVSKTMFPNYHINSITNGVHAGTWVSTHFQKVFDARIPGWKSDPQLLSSATEISNEEIWNAHVECKKQIIDFANATTNAGMDYDYFTIGWARRFTSYKRPDFIFHDLKRLLEIAKNKGPVQIIYSGKAHPKDTAGKELISEIVRMSQQESADVKMVYLPNYDMYLSKFITSGVDVWLNTPAPPNEASGTSGMKCALNGIPQISVLDGWWWEGHKEGKTGWAFSTPEELYDLLDKEIIPTYYNDRVKWQETMKQAIALNGSFFNTHRMLNEYIKYAYKPDSADFSSIENLG